jgi:hypothetical protein
MVTCVRDGFRKALGDTSTTEIDDELSSPENKLSDVPEGIINAQHSFYRDLDEDFLVFE